MTIQRGWKALKPDLTTGGGFKWYPGTTVRSDDRLQPGDHLCPKHPGDGLTIARTWRGASGLGAPTLTCVIVVYDDDNVLASSADGLRVKGPVDVLEAFDAQQLLRDGWGRGADLRHADLRHADLRHADLRDADLRDASLCNTTLVGVNLHGANLNDADLRHANLRGANLRHLDPHGVNLRYADLRYADLHGADLPGADLRDANLPEGWEGGPDGVASRRGTP